MSEVLKNWLGNGGTPVHRILAEERASVCELCNLNVAPKWWEANIVDPIASAIRVGLGIKEGMNLKLPQDNALHMCKNCGCCNQLHVWTPLEHITGHTSPETMEKFPDHCWIKTEGKKL
jgi:hypothetical protein